MKIGGVWVSFVKPQGDGPAPCYPYLIDVEPINDASGQETASASFTLSNKVKDIIRVFLKGEVEIFDKDGEMLFTGLVGDISYSTQVRITAEA